MKRIICFVILFAFAITLPLMVFGQAIPAPSELAVNANNIIQPDTPVEYQDIFAIISHLARNWKSLGKLGILSFILMIIIAFLKTPLGLGIFYKIGDKWRMLLIVCLGQVAGIILMVTGGIGWGASIIAGLLTSGGALAIWQVIKVCVRKS